MKEPAIGLLEFKSVARGIRTIDAVVKKAPVRLLGTYPMCPGKYMILFCGEVDDVAESMKEGKKIGGDLLINDIFIPQIHPSVIPALTASVKIEQFGAIGVIETFSIASCVIAADIAAKATPVKLVEMRLANGLGGKGFFIMTGDLADVEASTAAAAEYVRKEGLLAGHEIIQNPHYDVIHKSIYW